MVINVPQSYIINYYLKLTSLLILFQNPFFFNVIFVLIYYACIVEYINY